MKIHLETPKDIRHQIWKELGRASQDRHHEWRTPVLASTGQDGFVNARTVVLREANAIAGQLEFYTDTRSPKVAELLEQPIAALVFWSARLNWQLRVRAQFSVTTSGPRVEALWQRVKQSASANDYLSPTAPGTALPAVNVPADTLGQTANFTVLSAQVFEMNWLELSRDGHRCAKLGAATWEWITP